MAIHVKDGGTWKSVSNLYVKQSGSWKSVAYGFVKESGTWKQTFGNSCFAKGSQVLMADGSTKNIEDVVEGDRVFSYDIRDLPDEEWGGFITSNTDSFSESDTVVEHIKFSFRGDYYKLNGITVTKEHPFLIYDTNSSVYKFRRVEQLDPARHELVDRDLNHNPIMEMQHVGDEVEVINLDVETLDVYIVENMIVHNK